MEDVGHGTFLSAMKRQSNRVPKKMKQAEVYEQLLEDALMKMSFIDNFNIENGSKTSTSLHSITTTELENLVTTQFPPEGIAPLNNTENSASGQFATVWRPDQQRQTSTYPSEQL